MITCRLLHAGLGVIAAFLAGSGLRVAHAGSGHRHTFSGYFDYKHVPEMATAAAKFSGRAEGVYFTLNPVNPALLARAPNATIPLAMKDRATADRDIVRREYFLIDADPVRPSGVSSTDEEHELALERVRACAQWLGGEAGRNRPLPTAATVDTQSITSACPTTRPRGSC